MRRFLSVVFAFFLLTLPALAASHTVTIQNMKFSPASTSVAAGDTITFVNKDAMPHTATGAAFNTGAISPGGSKSVKVGKAGSFSYACSFHPSMKGQVTAK